MSTSTSVGATPGLDSREPLFNQLFPLLLAGYMLFGRSFAWLHIPGTPLFVGEIVLAFGLAAAFRAMTWRPVWATSSVPAVMAAYVAWGLARTLPGLIDDPIPAVRDAVLWLYVLIAWAVVGTVAAKPIVLAGWFRSYLRIMPLAVVWLPFTVVLGAMDFGTVPDSDVSLTSFDTGMMQIQALMILAFLWLVWLPETLKDHRWRAVISGVAILDILVLGTRNRGGFVGAVVGLALVLLLNEARTKLIVTAARVLLIAVVLVLVIDPRIDVGEREISATQLSDNITSLVTLSGDSSLGGNISWRLRHWSDIFSGVNRDVPIAGHGFGPNIAEIYHIPQTDIGLRNAHNSHLTLLARAGWTGVVLWIALWSLWFAGLNKARRRLRDTGYARLSGLCAWSIAATVGFHIEAFFNPSLEGPQTAFWLWAIFGLGLYLTVLSRPGRAARESQYWRVDPGSLEAELESLAAGRA